MTTGLQCFFEQYKKFCEDSSLGHNGICHDKELKELIKQWLIKRGADLATLLWVDVHEIIATSLQRSQNYPNIFKKLIGAFELLEMAAVNLFLYPWRKEFRTIKTFSGAYVYHLKPTICNEDLVRIFKKMGYKLKNNLELEMKDLPDSLQLSRLAFDFFVARIECEILLEVVGKLDHYKISVKELLWERKLMISVDSCVEKLNLTYSAAETERENQFKRTLPSFYTAEDIDVDLRPNSNANNQTSSSSQWEYNGSTIPLAMNGLYRSSSSDQYKDDTCSKHITGIPGTECIPPLNINDCKLEESQGLPKNRPELNSISNFHTARNGLDLKNYRLHYCLAGGESVRYCCETCCTAHSISCDSMKNCTGHPFTFFDGENSVYPQQAEAACDNLGQSSHASILKIDPACVICYDLPTHICNECGMCMCSYCGYRCELACKKCDKMLNKFKP
ncbi:spermatogenesis associated 2-like [Pristis pectinata]|uniref:spermatogenesis associated 2-like n=1 Tax=Pristis pectinata TaxID=685728 RepID=UPI00223CF53A|nr:spermatogenesis associated 2-like [Pristis pectinata]